MKLNADDENLGLAKALKDEGKNNVQIRNILREQGLDDEYITQIIMEVNPQYKTEPSISSRYSGEETSDSGDRKSYPVWAIILVIIAVLRLLMRILRD